MSYTLELDESLTEELQREAAAENVPFDELALRLMRDALRERIAEKEWRIKNRRRLDLIAKKSDVGLTPAEQEEFLHLQSLVHELAAPFDRVLLRSVARLREEVENLPEEPAS